jgi:hypothetical protein
MRGNIVLMGDEREFKPEVGLERGKGRLRKHLVLLE